MRTMKSMFGKLLRAVMRVVRIAVWSFILFTGIWNISHSENSPSGKSNVVYSVAIDSVINPGALGVLRNAIAKAEEHQAAALIVRIDTPGGLLSSTRDMVSAISESRVPVIGYVGPAGANAGSAGAFILLSTHVAVMNSGTNVGASSPVSGGGEDIEGTLGKKIMNDSKAFMRSIADSHGRNAEMAEKFVSEAHSLTAKEALEANVIDLIADDYAKLLKAVDGREIVLHGETQILQLAGSEIEAVEPRLFDSLLVHIAHPQIAHLLISLGALAIYIEISSPGLAFPGVFGAIAVILGLVGIQTLPVNVGFLMLLLLGITLMVSEYFVAGFGVLGIGGAIAFIFGSLYLFEAPSTTDYQTGILSISIAVAGAMLVTTFLISRLLVSGPKKVNINGRTGEAMMNFDRDGYVLVDGERWQAITEEPLRHGDKIVVIKKDETDRLTVRKQAM